ncbi:hypothetical protein BDP27DRAFT_1146375, partial [Rhodocollybia butyracea]
WLHSQMNWSVHKATHATQKLPKDWEEQCIWSAFWKAYLIKEYNNIPPELFINADQTQLLYVPGNKMTWAETGSRQVS